jgi:uncharacterized protein YcnI
MRHRHAAIAGALALLTLAPATAAAHISVHPNTIPAGAFATLDVRVPGEQAGAHVTEVDMLFPPGFTSAAYQNVPGWTTSVVYQKLPAPIQTPDGPVATEVSQIVWTWQGPLGLVANNQFINFPLSVAIPANDAGLSLAFKTVQTYSNGQVVHWIGPAGTDTPAPTVIVTTPGGVIEDVAGDEAGPSQAEATHAATVSTPQPGSSRTLAIAALVVGALGLLAGLSALVFVRRARLVR